MNELLKALQGLPETKSKKHFVTVDGKEIEVSLKEKLRIRQHGEDNFTLDGGKVVRKQPRAIKSKYRKLLPSENKGYHFMDDDIHWPERIGEGGLTWQIEYE